MADNTDITTFKIQRRETIKPCTPTPQHLRIVNLSLLDQVSPDMYVPLVLFYPFITNTSHPQEPIEAASERVQRLRETLSKTLARLYPFAGRLRGNRFVECNDEGAEFVEARAAFSMSKILESPNNDTLKKLVVARPESSQGSLGGCLLLVQATIFACGGIALGALFSHKIADACSVAEFVKAWARITSHDDDDDNEALVSKPDFVTASEILPPIILDSSCKGVSSVELVPDKCVTRRYVFTAEKIAAMKSKAASEGQVKNPTRVESVSGLLWKCAIKSSASRSTLWTQAMNVRKRVVPPLGQTVMGNLVMAFTAKADDQDDIELRVLAGKFRRGLEEEAEHYAKNKGYIAGIVGRRVEEFADRMKSNEVEMFGCSSWCRFGLYEADFGWGKPVWVSIVSWEYKNAIVLMDTRDGDGIEAWLSLSEQDMAHIESDQEFLCYASLNPSVVV